MTRKGRGAGVGVLVGMGGAVEVGAGERPKMEQAISATENKRNCGSNFQKFISVPEGEI
jgi:hypothetical protein